MNSYKVFFMKLFNHYCGNCKYAEMDDETPEYSFCTVPIKRLSAFNGTYIAPANNYCSNMFCRKHCHWRKRND